MLTDTVDHLIGLPLTSVSLPSTDGARIDLFALSGVSVVYGYPRTSPPDQPPIDGWDQIPGARGCTPQSKGFAAHHADILAAGAERIFGLSTQDSAYQSEMKSRLGLPFDILSDAELELAKAINLPTFEAGGMTLLTRLTFIIQDGKIEKVFYPVDTPEDNAKAVLAFLHG